MGRRSFLEQALPTWLHLSLDEIIIVDWGMLEPLEDLLALDPRIVILHVPDKDYFDSGRALNTGVLYAKSDLIFHIDADVKADRFLDRTLKTLMQLFDHPELGACIADISDPDLDLPLWGTCLFRYDAWRDVGGYFEGLRSWGGEDFFFFECLRKRYKVLEFFSQFELTHIYHRDVLRYEHRQVKNNTRNDEPAMAMIRNTPWPQAHTQQKYII
jgi:hypothetical protein